MIVVLIGLDEVLVIYVAIFVVIFCNWRCTLYILPLVLAILLDKDTFEPDPVVFATKTPQAIVRGAWSYSSFEACCATLHFLAHRRSHVARGQET